MPEIIDDALSTAFAEFRGAELSQIRPAGLAHARRQARRRRIVRRTGFSVLALIVLAVMVPTIAQWTSVSMGRQYMAGSGGQTRYVDECSSKDLITQVTGNSGDGAPPWVVISFINTYSRACLLAGYPALVATYGYSAQQGSPNPTQLLFYPVHGPVHSYPDNGTVNVLLEPQGAASFVLGATSDYSDQYVVTRVDIALPDSNVAYRIQLPIAMAATGGHGQPVAILLTALAAGKNGAPK